MKNLDVQKIVLAYSGGLDTSAMLHWMKQSYNAKVVAFIADVGQGEDLKAAEKKAYETGAEQVFISDLREEFVKEFVWPALKSNAVYEGEYLLGTSLARPVIAREQLRIAREVGADCVAHGATGKGNDQVRFELTYMALEPRVKILAPWRHWEFKSRTDLINYSKKHNISITSTEEKPYSIDQNVMHTSYEGGILEDPWFAPPEEIFLRTKNLAATPNTPLELILTFEKGEPVAINGEGFSPYKLLEKLNTLAGEHGIGRVDLVENRFVGMKSRGVYETPGLTVLQKAHRAVESLTLDREVMHLKDSLVNTIAEKIYYGMWFSPEMKLLLSFIDESQARASGEVRVELFKGNCTVKGRRSPLSLYDPNFATFEKDSVYNQFDAEGFIRLTGLRMKIASLMGAK